MNTNSLNVGDEIFVRNCMGELEFCTIVEMEGDSLVVVEFEKGILQTDREWLDEMFVRKADRKEDCW